jgi:hypothetical protein
VPTSFRNGGVSDKIKSKAGGGICMLDVGGAGGKDPVIAAHM